MTKTVGGKPFLQVADIMPSERDIVDEIPSPLAVHGANITEPVLQGSFVSQHFRPKPVQFVN